MNVKNEGSSPHNSQIYVFRGIVCYYGKHYVSIFQRSKLLGTSGEAQYLLFDDINVREIGNWNDVKEECVKSHYQPVLLLYELESQSNSLFDSDAPQSHEVIENKVSRRSTNTDKLNLSLLQRWKQEISQFPLVSQFSLRTRKSSVDQEMSPRRIYQLTLSA